MLPRDFVHLMLKRKENKTNPSPFQRNQRHTLTIITTHLNYNNYNNHDKYILTFMLLFFEKMLIRFSLCCSMAPRLSGNRWRYLSTTEGDYNSLRRQALATKRYDFEERGSGSLFQCLFFFFLLCSNIICQQHLQLP